MNEEKFRLLIANFAEAARYQRRDEGKLERELLAEIRSLAAVSESMIRELRPVFRSDFRGDNPVWACGKLRDDYKNLQGQVTDLRAENERLREALERILKESIDCEAREIAEQMLAHGR